MPQVLIRAVSRFQKPGPRRKLRLPISPWCGKRRTPVVGLFGLNTVDGLAKNWIEPVAGSSWMLGRRAGAFLKFIAAGLAKLKPTGKAVVVALKGNPLRAVKIPETSQPPMTWFTQPGAPLPNIRPRPNGNS